MGYVVELELLGVLPWCMKIPEDRKEKKNNDAFSSYVEGKICFIFKPARIALCSIT